MEVIRIQRTVQKNGELILWNLPVEKGQQVEVLLLIGPAEPPKRPRLTARFDWVVERPAGYWGQRQLCPTVARAGPETIGH